MPSPTRALAAALLFALGACGQPSETSPGAGPGAAEVAVPHPGQPADAGAVTTADLGPAGPAGPTADGAASPASPEAAPPAATANHFIGAQACGECHKKQLQRWQKDWHARALNPATASVVVGRFNDAHFKGSSSEAWMHRGPRGPASADATTPGPSGFVMRTLGADGKVGDFGVHWVIGGKRMQDTVTVLPDGRWQVLPVYYHVTGHGEWVDYTEAKQGTVDPAHPFFWTNWRRNANHECLDCHTTGLRVHFDRPGHRLTTEFTDPAVACESCHGPGGRHAESMDGRDIVHPGKVDPEAALALCAQCHGPRNPLFPILDAEHRFQPGDRYEDHFQPLVVVNGSGRSGDYFADGRPKTSSFEYQALLQSRCFRKGQVTCLTCHSAPHQEHGENELKLVKGAHGAAALADASCKGCHAPIVALGEQHTRHRSAAATSCVACHMPRVVQGVLDHFADHAIDVPVPQNSDAHQVPSACGQCHKDKSAKTLAAELLRLWPAAATRQQRRLRLAEAIDEQTAEQSRPALLAVLADTEEAPSLRGVCAQLLAQRFPRGAAVVLVPLLRSPEPLLRAQIIEALGAAKARDAAPAIAEHQHDPSLTVRNAVAMVLSTLGDPRGEVAARELATAPASAGLMQPHYLLAQQAFRRGDLTTTATELERAVDRTPYFTDGLLALSEVYLRRHQLDLVAARLAEALFFDPHSAPVKQRLAKLNQLTP